MRARRAIFQLDERGLELRRDYIGMTASERELLASMRLWARRNAAAIAAALSERVEVPRDWAARHFQDVFREAGKRDGFGVSYFERRLRESPPAGMAPKWFLGIYPVWLDLARDAMRTDVPEPARISKRFGGQAVDAEVLHRAERALARVFNYDAQAVVEAYVYDTLTAIGADLEAAGEAGPGRDLSDRLGDVRTAVRGRLEAFAAATGDVRARGDELRAGLAAVARGLDELAAGAARVGERAARQTEVAGRARAVAGHAATAAGEARSLGGTGIEAAAGATTALADARTRIEDAATAITALAGRSEQVGGIVEAIRDIASRTTVLAINAGIEAYHAGEQGQGFAIVADEVRRLAERAAKSAADAGELIAGIQGETDDAVEIVRDAAARTHAGTDATERTRTTLEEIEGAVGRIATELDGIAALIGDIAASAGENAASAERMTATTAETQAARAEVAACADRLRAG